jgi:hypothetical protein
MYTKPKKWSAPFIPKDPKFWIDYVSLRQCEKGAFNPAAVVKLIREIGLTLVKIPSLLNDPKTGSDFHYTKRSFCILESYATLAYGARMLVVLPSTKLRIVDNKASSGKNAIDENGEETGIPDEFALRGYFESNPIRSANARARGDVKSKQAVDNFIKSTTTFEEVDEILKGAIVGAGNAEKFYEPTTGPAALGFSPRQALEDAMRKPEAKAVLTNMQDEFRAQRANRRR